MAALARNEQEQRNGVAVGEGIQRKTLEAVTRRLMKTQPAENVLSMCTNELSCFSNSERITLTCNYVL
jgi:hypothetical protein